MEGVLFKNSLHYVSTTNTATAAAAAAAAELESAEQLRYFGAILTNQNPIHEEIKCRSVSGKACYHSVQKPLSSSSLSKNMWIKIY